MDNTLCTTRPDENGRLEKEMAVYDVLEKLNIPYVRMDHEVTPSIEACHDVDKQLGIEICKNLFLCNSQKTKFYLLLMPGMKKFKTKDLSGQLEVARLSFANETYMEEFLNITPGSVSIMGLMNDKEQRVRLVIDREVAESEYIGCHPCINTSSLKVKTKDILEKFLPYTGHDYTIVDL